MVATQQDITVLSTAEEMLKYFPLVNTLGYPSSLEDYQVLLEPMITRGYKQIIYKEDNKVIGLAGFWVNTKLFSGKYIEVDNVVVDPNLRSKGIGKILMDWIENHAREIDAKMIVLDAFAGNKAAHKFYFREGYEIKGFHFTKDL